MFKVNSKYLNFNFTRIRSWVKAQEVLAWTFFSWRRIPLDWQAWEWLVITLTGLNSQIFVFGCFPLVLKASDWAIWRCSYFCWLQDEYWNWRTTCGPPIRWYEHGTFGVLYDILHLLVDIRFIDIPFISFNFDFVWICLMPQEAEKVIYNRVPFVVKWAGSL